MQHHGHYHGGAIATIADVSGGFAAGTLIDMERGDTVLTVELKINFANAVDYSSFLYDIFPHLF